MNFFNALSLHDKKDILRTFLHGPSGRQEQATFGGARDESNVSDTFTSRVCLNDNDIDCFQPIFTFGPSASHPSKPVPPQSQQPSGSAHPKSRFQTTVEDAYSVRLCNH